MGKMILIGGHVDIGASLTRKERKEFGPVQLVKMVRLEILERLISEAKGVRSRIEIVTSASEIPATVGREYKRAFEKLKCKDVGVMHIRSEEEADLPENISRLKKCDCILFTGGDQNLLCKRFHNTKFLRHLKGRFRREKDFLISGTSAGAMALTRATISRDMPLTPFVKGYISIIKGFDLISGIIVDTHFIQRRRLARLIESVAKFPHKLGIGLSENTAVFFETPDRVEVIGNNVVVLIDGSHIGYNNIKQIRQDQNICLEDVRLHILPKGHVFSIPKRKIFKARIH